MFDRTGYKISEFKISEEGKGYNACTFVINNLRIIYRHAKITPAKKGQFVTLWKRNLSGITTPFDLSDEFDLVIINVSIINNNGFFIFPKEALNSNSIISGNGKKGKRGFRLYAPWDKVENRQAVVSQHWQAAYFSEMPQLK